MFRSAPLVCCYDTTAVTAGLRSWALMNLCLFWAISASLEEYTQASFTTIIYHKLETQRCDSSSIQRAHVERHVKLVFMCHFWFVLSLWDGREAGRRLWTTVFSAAMSSWCYARRETCLCWCILTGTSLPLSLTPGSRSRVFYISCPHTPLQVLQEKRLCRFEGWNSVFVSVAAWQFSPELSNCLYETQTGFWI